MNWQRLAALAIVGGTVVVTSSCSKPPYKDPNLPVEKRIDDLLSRMTLEEKIDLLSGDGAGTKENKRLGIPALKVSDGPLGPNWKGKATNYSANIGMAATWDTALVHEIGAAIGQETRAYGNDILLAPCVNIARVPHGGRTFEAFGEDPFLVSRLTVAYVEGVQSEDVGTSTKHYVANNQEWNRGVVDVHVSERALREIYFPAFKAAVQEAKTTTIMAAYNKINGYYACANKYLLTDVLKDEWGFQGLVMSDWGAIHSTVPTAKAGTDLEMPRAEWWGDKLLEAVKKGEVDEKTIDDKVRRILRVIYWLGRFDHKPNRDKGLINNEAHKQLALKTAREALTLLKNDGNVLPLDKGAIKKIAVIGPYANDPPVAGGGSAYLEPFYKVSVVEGLKNKLGPNVEVVWTHGIRMHSLELPPVPSAWLVPPDTAKAKHGLLGEYFNDINLEGEPVLKRVDAVIDFDWHDKSPEPGVVQADSFSARWEGWLEVPESGMYEVGVMSDNGSRLYLDGKLIIDKWRIRDAGRLISEFIPLQAGHRYQVRLEMFENIGYAKIRFGIKKVEEGDQLDKAVKLAQQSDAVVLCVGLRKDLEGEGHDRETLELPEKQIELIKTVGFANSKTVVVLYNGTPVLMDRWLGVVPAVLEAWYPGQEGGNAIADVLFGDVNPSGKLPLTFPHRWEDCPAYGTYPGAEDSAEYREGIFVGYRWFDEKGFEPLFPFGHGLSYTTFSYSDLKIVPDVVSADSSVTVQLKVKNTGEMVGDEVVQVYVHDIKSSLPRPPKELKGFARVHLEPGEEKTVEISLRVPNLAFYDAAARKWVVEPGEFQVLVGASSRDIRLLGKFTVK